MSRILSTPEGTFSLQCVGAVTPRNVPGPVTLATLHMNGGQVIETSAPYEDTADAFATLVNTPEGVQPLPAASVPSGGT